MSDDPEKKDVVSLTFDIGAAPFNWDPPYASTFYTVLGKLVVVSGTYEHLLTAHLKVAVSIGALLGADRQIRSSLFKAKADLLAELYSICEPLDRHAAKLTAILDDAKETMEDRNLLIHSQVDAFEDGPPPRLKMTHHRHHKGETQTTTSEPTVEEIEMVIDHVIRHYEYHLPYFLDAIQTRNRLARERKASNKDQ